MSGSFCRTRRSAALLGVGLVVTGASGCGAKGTITLTARIGGRYESLVTDLPGECRICVLPPKVTSNLAMSEQEYWGSTVQSQIERALQEAADRDAGGKGAKIVIVAPPQDHADLLDQQDRRIAGVVDADLANQDPSLVDYDVLVKGEIHVTVLERNEPKSKLNPMAIIPVIGSRICRQKQVITTEYAPYREVSVQAKFYMVNNRGVRLAPTTICAQPVISKGESGFVVTPFTSAKSLNAKDGDVYDAVSAIAPVFATEFFPQLRNFVIEYKSCGKETCVDACKALNQAAILDNRADHILPLVEAAVTDDPNCDHARFMLAIVLDLQGRHAEALSQIEQAITLSDVAEDLRSDKPDKRKKARNHEYCRFKESVRSRLWHAQINNQPESEPVHVTDVSAVASRLRP